MSLVNAEIEPGAEVLVVGNKAWSGRGVITQKHPWLDDKDGKWYIEVKMLTCVRAELNGAVGAFPLDELDWVNPILMLCPRCEDKVSRLADYVCTRCRYG